MLYTCDVATRTPRKETEQRLTTMAINSLLPAPQTLQQPGKLAFTPASSTLTDSLSSLLILLLLARGRGRWCGMARSDQYDPFVWALPMVEGSSNLRGCGGATGDDDDDDFDVAPAA
ncbi:hypothetical protein SEVIR_2G033800v4 [Setaria viridis]|uniref:Uncharacterized protein n=1 Tax=Setaria viridis TaxID=4556 RepID=A0A4U6VNF0_SETVI|nr:hypothetical protein SEVIR_2G033800v2 [Setaria viridis]